MEMAVYWEIRRLAFNGDGYWEEVGLVVVVEFRGDASAELEVLDLVLADRHVRASEEKNVGGLEDRVGVDAERDLGEAVGLVLELVHVAELGHGHAAAEDPGELAVLGNL